VRAGACAGDGAHLAGAVDDDELEDRSVPHGGLLRQLRLELHHRARAAMRFMYQAERERLSELCKEDGILREYKQ
jgi:hypothetical protein